MVHLRQPTENPAQAKLGRATLESRDSRVRVGHPPILYQRLANVPLLLPRHLLAGCTIMVANVLGWIVIFGWRSVGFRELRSSFTLYLRPLRHLNN